jgi:hypothetical protein
VRGHRPEVRSVGPRLRWRGMSSRPVEQGQGGRYFGPWPPEPSYFGPWRTSTTVARRRSPSCRLRRRCPMSNRWVAFALAFVLWSRAVIRGAVCLPAGNGSQTREHPV